MEKGTKGELTRQIVEELSPFTPDFMLNVTTILSEEELEQDGGELLHPERKTLLQRYREGQISEESNEN